MFEVSVSGSENKSRSVEKKVGITATCSYGIEGWSRQSTEGRVIFAPVLSDLDLSSSLSVGWHALETGFRSFLEEIDDAALAAIAPLRLEQRITITILPKAKKPIDAVHGVRYILAKRIGLSRRKDQPVKLSYPHRGAHPVVALHCFLRSRNDRKFLGGAPNICYGVREATLTRRLELSGEKGFEMVSSDLFGMAQMQGEKVEAIRETPKLLKSDPEIGMKGDPVGAFRRGWKAVEAWEHEPEPERDERSAPNASQGSPAEPTPKGLRKRGRRRVQTKRRKAYA